MFKALYNSKAYAGASAADAYAYANNTLFDAKNGGLGYQACINRTCAGEPNWNKFPN